jgi:zinc protease
MIFVLGSGPLCNVERILQAIRLSIISPKVDCVFFEKWKLQQIRRMENKAGGMSTVLVKYLNFLNSKFNPWGFREESEVRNMRLGCVLERYADMYENDGNYVFFVSGNFDVDSISFLLNKYIGTIPVVERRRNLMFFDKRNDDISPQTRVFYDDSLETSRIDILFPVTMPETVCSSAMIQIIQDELGRLVMDRLRTKEGISYAPSVNLSRIVGNKYFLSVYFDCANDRIDDGIRFVKEEFIRLRSIETQYLLFGASQNFVRSRMRENVDKRAFWSEFFLDTFFVCSSLDRLMDYNSVINEVTVDSICNAMQLFSHEQAMVFVLRPKSSSAN